MNPDRQSSQETSNMLSRSSLSSRLSGQRTGPKRQSLSGARLEKKRTADRESQRAGRERAKNYIRHLEMLVESLQQAQGDDRLKILTEQCQEQREQNERLISIISSIGRLSRSMELPATTPWIEPNPSTTSSPPVSTAGAAIESTVDQHPPTVRASGVDLGRPIPAYNNQSLWPQPSMSVMGEQPLTSNPLPICTGSSSPNVYSRTRMNINPVSNIQTQANIMQNPHISAAFTTTETMVETIPEAINNILTEAELFTVISTGPREDADIAIRAVVSGWNTVKRAYTLDQGWEALRRIDQEVFSSCGLIERLAILRVMRLKLRHAVNPINENFEQLPQFMRLRPAQNLIQHPSLVDYFVWPDLRDLFILSPFGQKREHSALFVSTFVANLRFRWPLELCDVWTKDAQSSLYSFSSSFRQSFEDIRSWALDSEFFEFCPELIGYIPIYNHAQSRVLGSNIPQEHHHNKNYAEQAPGEQGDIDELD